MNSTRMRWLLLSVALVVLVNGPGRLKAQACSVVGAGATNAAGNSIPIWSCEDGPDVMNRGYVPPPKPDVWGAVAIATNLEWGSSWNHKSEAAAKAEALSRCKAASKRNDCKIAVIVADVCVSLALSRPERMYAVGGPTGAANYADANATLHCQRGGGHACTIAASFCADGVRHIWPMKDGPVVPYGRVRK